ncbi:MAG: SGNH/GDSL hydrolase family protein [Patescibacteria group bacterium]
MKKKTIFFLVLLIIIVAVIYLNRSFAYIYHKIGQEHLPPVNKEMIYDFTKNPSASTTFTFVALGDSLTAGVGATIDTQSWPYLVADRLADQYGKVRLVNLGQPGVKSADLLSWQLPSAIAFKPDYATLLIGVNDIHNHVSVDDFIKNVSLIIDELQTKTRAKVLLINIPYIGSPRLVLPPYDFYFQSRTKEFNQVLAKLCQDKKITCLDLYHPSLKESASPDFYSADLFHPSSAGYLSWSKIIYAN